MKRMDPITNLHFHQDLWLITGHQKKLAGKIPCSGVRDGMLGRVPRTSI